MTSKRVLPTRVVLTSLACLIAVAPVRAALIELSPDEFRAATLIDFNTSSGPEWESIHGYTAQGVVFDYFRQYEFQESTFVGPAITTNHVSGRAIMHALYNDDGVLSMQFATPQTRMAYGYALNWEWPLIRNATTVSLFDATN